MWPFFYIFNPRFYFSCRAVGKGRYYKPTEAPTSRAAWGIQENCTSYFFPMSVRNGKSTRPFHKKV